MEGERQQGEEIQTTVCTWCEKVIVQGNSKKISHGICPACAKKYFPELVDGEESKEGKN